MENIYYGKTIADDYRKSDKLTLLDFIKICDMLELAVFEYKVIDNPFTEPHRTINTKIYKNMSEYRETMPSWSARAYDYEADRPTYYLDYDGIREGSFEVLADNKSTSYRWVFEVVGQCVVIHHRLAFTD